MAIRDSIAISLRFSLASPFGQLSVAAIVVAMLVLQSQSHGADVPVKTPIEIKNTPDVQRQLKECDGKRVRIEGQFLSCKLDDRLLLGDFGSATISETPNELVNADIPVSPGSDEYFIVESAVVEATVRWEKEHQRGSIPSSITGRASLPGGVVPAGAVLDDILVLKVTFVRHKIPKD